MELAHTSSSRMAARAAGLSCSTATAPPLGQHVVVDKFLVVSELTPAVWMICVPCS